MNEHYYHFYNVTKGRDNFKDIESVGYPWVEEFMSYTEEEQIEVFKEVISINGWDKDDVISAFTDNADSEYIHYKNGKIQYVYIDYDNENHDELSDCY